MEFKELKDAIDPQHLREQMHKLQEELQHLRDKVHADQLAEQLSGHLNHLNRELANAITHGLGTLFFIVAIPVLLAYSATHASFSFTISAAIFGFSLLLVYMSSTLYHGIQHQKTKRIMRIFDHMSIFLLIGGSYTPLVQHYLDKDTSTLFLSILWSIIGLGCIFKIFFTGRYEKLSTAAYLGLGWMAVFIIRPIMEQMPAHVFYLLLASGFCYTVGVIFYTNKKIPYHHAVWHLFVLGGSVTHYLAVFGSIPS